MVARCLLVLHLQLIEAYGLLCSTRRGWWFATVTCSFRNLPLVDGMSTTGATLAMDDDLQDGVCAGAFTCDLLLISLTVMCSAICCFIEFCLFLCCDSTWREEGCALDYLVLHRA